MKPWETKRLQTERNKGRMWYTKTVGDYVIWVFEYWFRTPMGIWPVEKQTVIGRITHNESKTS